MDSLPVEIRVTVISSDENVNNTFLNLILRIL